MAHCGFCGSNGCTCQLVYNSGANALNNAAYNRAMLNAANAQSQNALVNAQSQNALAMTPAQIASMLNSSATQNNPMPPPTNPSYYDVVYKVASDKMPRHWEPGKARDGEAMVYGFTVGKMPAGVVVVDIDAYLDYEDVPEKFREAAMILHAGYNDEDLLYLKGVGSVRKALPGVLYFRVFTD